MLLAPAIQPPPLLACWSWHQSPLHSLLVQAQLDRLEALLLQATGGLAAVASAAADSASRKGAAENSSSSSQAAAQE